MHKALIVGLMFSACFSLPARAAFTTIQYTAKVTQVLDSSQAPFVSVGDTISYSLTFDPSTLHNVGSTFFNRDAISGNPVPMPGLRAATLSAPGASATITLDGHTLTAAEDPYFGVDVGLGVGQPVQHLQRTGEVELGEIGEENEADVERAHRCPPGVATRGQPIAASAILSPRTRERRPW